jgi:hypothetical protein
LRGASFPLERDSNSEQSPIYANLKVSGSWGHRNPGTIAAKVLSKSHDSRGSAGINEISDSQSRFPNQYEMMAHFA